MHHIYNLLFVLKWQADLGFALLMLKINTLVLKYRTPDKKI